MKVDNWNLNSSLYKKYFTIKMSKPTQAKGNAMDEIKKI